MDIRTAIQRFLDHADLNYDEMRLVMQDIMTGACTPSQIAGFLVGLRIKGETVDEISAAAEVMRELSTKVMVDKQNLIDTCGTGGDGANTFNISTTAAFVTAAAGARVAKHGNRSVSSKSGSADVLEAAGIKLELTPDQVAECIKQLGIGFMFAPMHHSAMKHAITPRHELGVRTIFNILGPLTNPAGAPNQVIGVFSSEWMEKIVNVLQKLGANHVMVVHADDGMDEISIAASTQIAELVNGETSLYRISPEQFGIGKGSVSDLAVNNIQDSLTMMISVLDNQPGPALDIVRLNAGAAIYTAGITENLEAGIELATKTIAQGAARKKLDDLVILTQTF